MAELLKELQIPVYYASEHTRTPTSTAWGELPEARAKTRGTPAKHESSHAETERFGGSRGPLFSTSQIFQGCELLCLVISRIGHKWRGTRGAMSSWFGDFLLTTARRRTSTC